MIGDYQQTECPHCKKFILECLFKDHEASCSHAQVLKDFKAGKSKEESELAIKIQMQGLAYYEAQKAARTQANFNP
jgi:hypothetical protein